MGDNLVKRKKNRLQEYDYSEPGAYFITICTKNKEKLLWKGNVDPLKFDWELVGGHSVHPRGLPLSKVGIIVEQALQKWNETYDNVYLSSYIIMPNHLHLMVVIQHCAGGCTECPPTISLMVKYFKSSVTKQLGMSIWQQSFYDHVIRDHRDYEKISEYIRDNPLHWQDDELYDEI